MPELKLFTKITLDFHTNDQFCTVFPPEFSTGGGISLYALKLDMDEASALVLKSGGLAVSPACVITDATVNVGIRVNENNYI